MDTNKSKFTERDLREVRKELDPRAPENKARKKNRDLRKKMARRTRRKEREEFLKMYNEGRLDEAQDAGK